MRRGYTKGLRYTIDLSKIADRENPRTVQAPIAYTSAYPEPIVVDWGDGTPPETITTGLRPAHTYADGAGDVFTVVIRSATGNFPSIAFTNTYNPINPVNNITYAVISVDHFSGRILSSALVTQSPYLSGAINVRYIDTRLHGQPNYRSLVNICDNCGNLEQPIESWCFDFCAADDNATFSSAFRQCPKITGSPEKLFTHNTSAKGFPRVFRNCTGLTGRPFVFWKPDGTIDTDKFPNLTSASDATEAYYGCSADMRAQVPTDYGGTMTVS